MVNGKEAVLEEYAVHKVSTEPADRIFNDRSERPNGEAEQEFLRKLLLKPFANHVHTSEFTHPVAPEHNVLFNLCKAMGQGQDLLERSIGVAGHLVNAAQDHDMNDGELFVSKWRDVEMNGKRYDAIGIHKFDDKEYFLETQIAGGSLEPGVKRGLADRRPDKACLVVLTEEPFTLLIIDNNDSTGYWQKEMIGHRPKSDHVNSTMGVLEMTKDFITKQLPQDYEIAKADQIDLLNRSVRYFKNNSEYDKDSFEQEVFVDEKVIRSFQQFGDRFKGSHDVELLENFEIAPQAVKRQARVFKSVIKLDKNFHIYIHGDRNRIEHGVDEEGRKFYKIYYDQES